MFIVLYTKVILNYGIVDEILTKLLANYGAICKYKYFHC